MTTTSKRIPIVDDYPLLAKVLAHTFESEGFDVSLACNGRESTNAKTIELYNAVNGASVVTINQITD